MRALLWIGPQPKKDPKSCEIPYLKESEARLSLDMPTIQPSICAIYRSCRTYIPYELQNYRILGLQNAGLPSKEVR